MIHSYTITAKGVQASSSTPLGNFTHEIECTPAQILLITMYLDGETGMLIQDLLPDLNPADREFLISGIPADKWEELISDV